VFKHIYSLQDSADHKTLHVSVLIPRWPGVCQKKHWDSTKISSAL